jgi:hypothetical protein
MDLKRAEVSTSALLFVIEREKKSIENSIG